MVFDMHIRGPATRWATFVATCAMFVTLLVLSPPDRALGPVEPSAAGTTYLCSGYKACKQAGYPHAGYAGVSDQMFWRMYAGHNCTNYVAYRMIKAGMSTTRPWTGNGNASEWGKHMARITDKVANVGAVAWWGKYSNGSGSAGHVAYVERVVSADEIIVSEDSWGGTFHWRRITRSSGRWPTGFIHFVDKRVAGVTRPVISGLAKVGSPLTATVGTWSGGPTGYTYQWYADGVAISGATAARYIPVAAVLGKKLTVRVTAVKAGATSGVQDSLATAAVTEGSLALTAPPVITGAVLLDEVLTASAGTWSPTPSTTVWRWFADGVRIENNTTARLPLTADLVGKTISLKVVAKQAGYVNVVSAPFTVGEVLAGAIEAPTPATVLGAPIVGEVLTVTPAAITPTDAAVIYRWVRDGVPITGATALSYRLTSADVGRRIGVEITATRPQYLPYTATLPGSARVSSPAQVTVVTKNKAGRAVIRVKVKATGMSPVKGKVLIRIGKWTETVRLVDGKARVAAKLSRGTKKVRVSYLGSAIVPAAKTTGTVRIR